MAYEDSLRTETPPDKPVNLLNGEEIKISCKITDGNLISTNYRVILENKETIHHIPLGVIESVDCVELVNLHLLCKDSKFYKCVCSTNEECLELQRRLLRLLNSGEMEDIFAFKFFSSSQEEGGNKLCSSLNDNSDDKADQMFAQEFKRMQFDTNCSWRITQLNLSYNFCATYPKKLIVPSCISDKDLEKVAKYRMSRRIPAVVYRHIPNGTVIVRSSQPELGWLGWRCAEDESYIKAIADACAFDRPSYVPPVMPNTESETSNVSPESNGYQLSPEIGKEESFITDDIPSLSDFDHATSPSNLKKVLVIDARSYTTAVANRARGGGCECSEYYDCEIQFMNLPNIHTVRKSHQALRALLSMPPDTPTWLSLLENTRWITHISALIKSAVTVSKALAIEGRPVLVHCSDGWDRTPQITSLAQILLDSHYRTIEGFITLIEKEWIEFGHKFADRNGCGFATDDPNERSPIFLQFLDCVHQLLIQFPIAFQFNQAFLVKLAQHLYSNLYGTFLTNSSCQKNSKNTAETYSLWTYIHLNIHRFYNYLYVHTQEILHPSFQFKDLHLWRSVYVPENDMENHCFIQHSSEQVVEEESYKSAELIKTKSCDDIPALTSSSTSNLLRRSSDPNIRDSYFNILEAKCESGTSDQYELASPSDVSAESSSKGLESIENGPPVVNHVESSEGPAEDLKISGDTTYTAAKSNLYLADNKRSIEGSTDTLVAELGVLSDEPPVAVSIESKREDFENSKPFENKSNGYPEEFGEADKAIVLNVEINGDRNFQKNPQPIIQNHSTASNSQSKQSNNDQHLNMNKLSLQETGKNSSEHPKYLNGFGKNPTLPMFGQHSSSAYILHFLTAERCNGGVDCTSSNFPLVDGLSAVKDDTTKRLQQIIVNFQASQESLKRELTLAKQHNQQLTNKIQKMTSVESKAEDEVSLPESLGSGSAEGSIGQDSCVSESSWENVEKTECDPTLWVPDHAVDHCSGCNLEFWIGRRKHHCRNCGNIFCAQCSNNCAPLPKENLFHPVRVCISCYPTLYDHRRLLMLAN